MSDRTFAPGDYVAWETNEPPFQHTGTIQRFLDGPVLSNQHALIQVEGSEEVVQKQVSSLSRAVRYIAEYGDWVRLADGRAATVVRAQPCSTTVTGAMGAYYDLMFKGGHEITVFHWDGDDHLTFGHPSRAETMPLFTVVSQEA